MVDQTILDRQRYVGLGAAGAALGLVAGILARPTFMGVKIPLSVVTSRYPGDAPFKSELLTHLGLYLAAGVGIGLIAAFGLISIARGAAPAAGSPRPEEGDGKRWQVLADVDPDIAAQVQRLAPFGQGYVDELAQKYLAIGDKAYLAQIADQIASRAEAAREQQKAALQDRNNRFQGFRCFYDEQGRFVGEVSVDSGEFHVFRSQGDFEEAVRDYVTRGRPPIASRAIARATWVAPTE
ncbi:MAG TPA: hypothetical protein VGN82_17065 [Bosea sp. (in: a-proteobacteria)]|jgi:hypothetical protein|uniref:hypothetical protein n=1 Tax=Bosea sp. (in: a-proteobacteria) TaxID=1871050 RepID=UPI002E1401D7|nr:hypothetical protein [Bosea sp. (in: a-proteobacteria)]